MVMKLQCKYCKYQFIYIIPGTIFIIVPVDDVVMVISQLLMTTEHDQIRRHSTFCLCSLAKTYPNWCLHCPAGLKEAVEQNLELLNDPEYEVGTAVTITCYYHPLNVL